MQRNRWLIQPLVLRLIRDTFVIHGDLIIGSGYVRPGDRATVSLTAAICSFASIKTRKVKTAQSGGYRSTKRDWKKYFTPRAAATILTAIFRKRETLTDYFYRSPDSPCRTAMSI